MSSGSSMGSMRTTICRGPGAGVSYPEPQVHTINTDLTPAHSGCGKGVGRARSRGPRSGPAGGPRAGRPRAPDPWARPWPLAPECPVQALGPGCPKELRVPQCPSSSGSTTATCLPRGGETTTGWCSVSIYFVLGLVLRMLRTWTQCPPAGGR